MENKIILTKEEIASVKGLGCLKDKRYNDIFNVRVLTRNGKVSTEFLKCIHDAANKFGSGEVTLTTRLSFEIQGVKYSNINNLLEFLKENGIDIGGTGAKIRPIVSCKGTTCQYGNIDTYKLSDRLHDEFFIKLRTLKLPHKFKIAVGGCPNNCVKPNLNDIGIVGQRVPKLNEDDCKSCNVCKVIEGCPIQSAKRELNTNKAMVNNETCNHCGRCISMCPFKAVSEEYIGYKIYIGGRWGKEIGIGKALSKILKSEEEVINIINKIIYFYEKEGKSKERFSQTIDRLGFENVEKKLLS